MKFLQVGRGSILQHAVPLQAVVGLCQPAGDLEQTWDKKKKIQTSFSCHVAEKKMENRKVGEEETLTSSVIFDFLFRVRDTSLCLTLFLFWLSTELVCSQEQFRTEAPHGEYSVVITLC